MSKYKEREQKNIRSGQLYGRAIHDAEEMASLRNQPEPQSHTTQPVEMAELGARPISDSEAVELGIKRNGYSWSDIMNQALGLGVGAGAYYGFNRMADYLNRDYDYQRANEEYLNERRENIQDQMRNQVLENVRARARNLPVIEGPLLEEPLLEEPPINTIRNQMSDFFLGNRPARPPRPSVDIGRGSPAGEVLQREMRTRPAFQNLVRNYEPRAKPREIEEAYRRMSGYDEALRRQGRADTSTQSFGKVLTGIKQRRKPKI